MAAMDVDSPAASNPVESGSQGVPMEIRSAAGGDGTVMAAASVQGSVTISIHPLVVMNMSEHFTRVKAQAKKATQVYGAIIGKQKGRQLELINSFEISVEAVAGVPSIDMEFFRQREAQYKEVFAALDILGWYTTGDTPTQSDIAMHRQVIPICESPVFLKLNPLARNTNENLPISVYESVIDIVAGEANVLFIPLPYSLVTEEAERIGVDHVARISRATTGELSVVTEQMIAEHLAIKMLHSRVQIILRYMEDVAAGKMEGNLGVLREVKSLCCRLPVINTDKFRKQFYHQCNDVALISYLGALTKTCDTMNQLVNKLNVVSESRAGGFSAKRFKSLFM